MIQGLKPRHIVWFTTFTFILVMAASTNNGERLNWNVLTSTGSNIINGSKGLISVQSEIASQIDSDSAKRYGFSSNEKRLNDCVTRVAHNVELNEEQINSLIASPPANKEALRLRLGIPVCQAVTGKEKYFIKGKPDQVLTVRYTDNKPFVQLENVEK